MRLRQIALVAKDIAAVQEDVADVLGLDYAYADPGVGVYGLQNAVFPIGDTFLEIVSPKQPGTTAGRLIEKRAGDGGYMVIMQVEDLQLARKRIRDAGARVVDQLDREGCAFTHIHPRDVGGAILSLDYMDPPERWEWGGKDWITHVKTDVSLEIVGAALQADDPGAMAARWSAVIGRPARPDGDGFSIAVDRGEIRFGPICDGRGEGLAAFDLRVQHPSEVFARAEARGLVDDHGAVTLAGTRVMLLVA